MKGIVLAGGSGTRLYPMTKVLSKQLLPIFDKPLVYYPLTTLMLAGLQDIMVISTPEHLGLFQSLLGDGSQWGVALSYGAQKRPAGLPEAFMLAEEFIRGSYSALILGDNIFYGQGLTPALRRAAERRESATIFAYRVNDPERYGVVEFDNDHRVLSLEEKPKSPRSHYAIPGLYFVDDQAAELSRSLRPSQRGELEITDLQKQYLMQGKLQVEPLGRGIAWFDTGTPESMQEAASFIEAIERRQGLKVACPEEIAFRQGFINAEQLEKQAAQLGTSSYGNYLRSILMGE